MRRTGVPLALILLLGLVAGCGGGGDSGPDEAFCDALDTLSEQISDGDDIDDQIDTIEDDLADSADDGEQLDAVEAVADAYEDTDNDQADLADEVQDELGDFAEECEIDEDEFAIAPTTTTTTTTEPPETTTTEPPDTTQPPEGGGPEVLARSEVPAGIAAEFVDLAGACFNGDMNACDTLYDTTPIDSVDEAYGATCGGRLAEADAQPSNCATIIVGPVEVPPDVADQATAQACFGGDMVACDDLFTAAADGSIDQVYGALCAGRVPDTNAFCVAIFGDVAVL